MQQILSEDIQRLLFWLSIYVESQSNISKVNKVTATNGMNSIETNHVRLDVSKSIRTVCFWWKFRIRQINFNRSAMRIEGFCCSPRTRINGKFMKRLFSSSFARLVINMGIHIVVLIMLVQMLCFGVTAYICFQELFIAIVAANLCLHSQVHCNWHSIRNSYIV